MKRDVSGLESNEFDLLVIGGGIFGACAAWDAAQRGLSTALIERQDWASATSAHSYKMVHGGIRYIQHGDVFRVRQSSAERRAFLRIAPHLVQPLPIVIPTYGHGLRGKAFLRTGMALYDLLTLDRNRGIRSAERKIPNCRSMSRDETLELFPGLKPDGLTGSAVFCDGQMYNPTRLVLGVVRSAFDEGAVVANYVEALSFVQDDDRIKGARVRDCLTGDEFEIRAKCVINAAGPYSEHLLKRGLEKESAPVGPYSRDACFVIGRRLFKHDFAVAVQGATKDPEAIVGRGERHLFLVPWRNYTLVGVWHKVYQGDPDSLEMSAEDLHGFLDEINGAYPDLKLTIGDVTRVNCGLVPFGENEDDAVNLKYGHRSQLIDHGARDRLQGLITLIGVRYTTGRFEACRAVNLACRKLGVRSPACRTDRTPLPGGDIESMESLLVTARSQCPPEIPDEILRSLVRNYGTEYGDLLSYLDEDPTLAMTLGTSRTIQAQVVHGIRHEMAMKLTDLLFRRTDIGTGEDPGIDEIMTCVNLMAVELCWDEKRVEDEVQEVLELSTAAALERSENLRSPHNITN